MCMSSSTAKHDRNYEQMKDLKNKMYKHAVHDKRIHEKRKGRDAAQIAEHGSTDRWRERTSDESETEYKASCDGSLPTRRPLSSSSSHPTHTLFLWRPLKSPTLGRGRLLAHSSIRLCSQCFSFFLSSSYSHSQWTPVSEVWSGLWFVMERRQDAG